MKQTQNQFFGKVGDMPHILPAGSIYVCTDTNQTFASGLDQIPVEISGIDDATKAELAEVLSFSRQNTQGYYALLSGFYFGGVATETIITVAETNQWIDVIMTVDSAGVFDYRTTGMKDAQASGHTGDGSDGSPLVFNLEGLTLSSTASIRAAMTFDPDEDGGRFESKLLFSRHSGTTPSEDFEIASSALVIESGADLDYSHTPNTQFFIGDTIDTNGAGDAGTVKIQVKTDVAGTLSMREIALFIQS